MIRIMNNDLYLVMSFEMVVIHSVYICFVNSIWYFFFKMLYDKDVFVYIFCFSDCYTGEMIETSKAYFSFFSAVVL